MFFNEPLSSETDLQITNTGATLRRWTGGKHTDFTLTPQELSILLDLLCRNADRIKADISAQDGK